MTNNILGQFLAERTKKGISRLEISSGKGLLLIVCFFLVACASIEDFKAMTAQERADYVCSDDDEILKLSNTINSNEANIEEIKSAIRRGYRLNKNCSQEKIDYPISYKTNCTTSSYGSVNCETKDNRNSYLPKTKLVCIETKIFVNVISEQARLKFLKDEADEARDEKSDLYALCYKEVLPMTAEQAFQKFKN